MEAGDPGVGPGDGGSGVRHEDRAAYVPGAGSALHLVQRADQGALISSQFGHTQARTRPLAATTDWVGALDRASGGVAGGGTGEGSA